MKIANNAPRTIVIVIVGFFMVMICNDVVRRNAVRVDSPPRTPYISLEHDGAVTDVSVSFDGNFVAVATHSNSAPCDLYIWDIRTRETVLRRDICEGTGLTQPDRVLYQPDGNLIVYDHTGVYFLDGDTGDVMRTVSLSLGGQRAIDFTADSRYFVIGSADHALRIIDSETGERLVPLVGNTGRITAVAFSSDGTRVASSAANGVAIVWDVASGAILSLLEGHPNEVNSIDFNNDGTRVVTAGIDGTVRIWDVFTGEELLRMDQNTGGGIQLTAQYSPDGAHIVTGDWLTANIRIWDAQTGDLVRPFRHTRYLYGAFFSPDGRTVYSWSTTEVRVWDIAPDD